MKLSSIIVALLLIMFATRIKAQPVIRDGSDLPKVGFSGQEFRSHALGPGSAGANQTWDFSSLTFDWEGDYRFVPPESTPFAGTFPSATQVRYTISGFLRIYIYYSNSEYAFKWLGTGVTPMQGNYISSISQTRLNYPFTFGDSVTDTARPDVGSPYAFGLKYDSYGTVKIAGKTFTGVIRVAECYSFGTYYEWYTQNPLTELLSYDPDNQTIFLSVPNQEGVQSSLEGSANLTVSPNPSISPYFHIFSSQSISSGILSLYNMIGQEVRRLAFNGTEATIDRSQLPAGAYTYILTYGHSQSLKGRVLLL